jgi:hypothetical protein
MTPIARPSSPRVLLPPPPRQTTRRRGIHPAIKTALFFLIPHVWVGLGLIAFIVNGVALAVVGHVRTGQVIDRQVTHGKGTHYQIVYAYEESGRRFQDRADVSSADYDGLPPGSQVAVKSLHVGPLGGSRLAGALDRRGNGILCMAFFAILWNGFLFFLFYNLVLAPLRQRALVRDGDAVPGRILSKKEQKGKSTTYTVTYFYVTLDDSKCTGSMTVRGGEYHRFHEGDDVTILYAPKRLAARSVIYECSDYLATDACGYAIHP